MITMTPSMCIAADILHLRGETIEAVDVRTHSPITLLPHVGLDKGKTAFYVHNDHLGTYRLECHYIGLSHPMAARLESLYETDIRPAQFASITAADRYGRARRPDGTFTRDSQPRSKDGW